MSQFLEVAIGVSSLTISVAVSALLWSMAIAVWALVIRPQGQSREAVQAAQLAREAMPDTVKEIIEQESESWARDEIRDEAIRLHGILASWEKTEIELRRRYPPLSADEAADAAWAQAAETPIEEPSHG